MNRNKKQWLSLILVLSILLSSMTGSVYAAENSFDDIKGHWAENIINDLTDKDIIYGYPDGLCHPDLVITRAEFSALVARSMKITSNDIKLKFEGFKDTQGNFAEEDICKLVDAGIILKEEYGESYYPNEPISRLEIIKMMVRSLNEKDFESNVELAFTDLDGLSKDDLKYIQVAKEYDIISGYLDGTLRPEGEATRAESFSMLYSLIKFKDDKSKTSDEEAEKEVDNNDDKHEHVSYYHSPSIPAPQYTFEVPSAVYVEDEVKIVPKSYSVKSVTWAISKDKIPLEMNSTVDGNLTNQGGSIKFKSVGSYTLTARAMNSRGKTISYEQKIDVYPMVSLDLELVNEAHTDTTVIVYLKTENIGDKPVEWSVKEDDKFLEIDSIISGELSNEGGNIQFQKQGKYELIASIEDDLGKTIVVSDKIKVYPVAKLKINMAEQTYLDRPATLKTETENMENMELKWVLTRNSEEVQLDDFINGEINKGEGTLSFKEKGVYNLTASAIDETGRTYTDSASIVVYPVGSAGFYLPEIFHTDSKVVVEASFIEIGDNQAVWELFEDGKSLEISDFITGDLTNKGGEIRFINKGEYLLRASFTDGGGRSYSYEQTVKVYPVLTISYSLPESVHMDTRVNVKVDSQELGDLTIEWLLDNTFGFQEWSTFVEGGLTDEGGSIRFKRAGMYELVARVIDETGRVFLFEAGDRVEVLPVLEIGFELPKFAYTDSILKIRTHGNNSVLPIEWKLTENGERIDMMENILGELNAYGGEIRINHTGDYVLSATMIDFLGREFSYSQEIRINPTIQYTFTMPESVHFGKEIEVKTSSSNLDGNLVNWSLEKAGEPVEFDGELTNQGGKISIRDTGNFTLKAKIVDLNGRVYESSRQIEVTNTAPEATLSVETFRNTMEGKFFAEIDATASDLDGDETTLEFEGRTTNDYYEVGNHLIKVRAKDEAGFYSEWTERRFTIVNTAPTVTVSTRQTKTTKDGKFLIEIEAIAEDAEGDTTTLEFADRMLDDYYEVGEHTIKVRARDEAGLYSPWLEKSFTVVNSAPTVTLTTTPTRTSKNGKFLVEVRALAEDADGHTTSLEFEGRTSDDYYAVGNHTIRVKAKDEVGFYSEWLIRTFEIKNLPPTAPVITRSPSGNSVAPGTPVTITGHSTDPDGDAITYVWDGRSSQTQTYPLGKNVVRVKAVDASGAESPWAAIVFFVADANSGGGMTLTGPDSVILENGLDGATITKYTFTVPPVSGHSGSDFGRVRGFNIKTNGWEQLDYETTSNGITFSRNLSAGTYSKLEFYYYTNHNCMYNKSNITYTVEYHLE